MSRKQVLVQCGLSLLLACAPETEEAAPGQISVFLTAQSPSGQLYRLRNATFEIFPGIVDPNNPPAPIDTVSTEDDPLAASIDVTVDPGLYAVVLLDGWRLDRVDPGGDVTVEAQLLSNNVVFVSVASGQTSPAIFRFQTNGVVISTGPGEISIGIEVEEVPAGLYTFTCVLPGLGIPLPVEIQINADDPGFTNGVASDLTTLLGYSVAPQVLGFISDVAPDAEITVVDATVGIASGIPTEIVHTAVGLPFAPVGEFDSDEVTTSVTPAAGATEIALSVDAFTTRIDGLPENLVEGGTILLIAGEGGCGALEPAAGSGPLLFTVQ